jgi:hypothetical protein
MGLSAAVLVPLIASAASAGVNLYNTHQTQNKRDNILAQSIRDQLRNQGDAAQQTNDLIARMQQSSDVNPQAKTQATYQDVLNANRASSTGGLGQQGAVSSAFSQDASQVAQGLGNYGTAQATDLSKMAAPHLQRINEGNDARKYQETLNAIRQRVASERFLEQLKLKAVHPDPWLSALASLGQGFAGSYNFGGAKAPSKPFDMSNWFSGNATPTPGLLNS